MLEGGIPDSLYGNENLVELRLDNNTLGGPLSPLVGNLELLEDFRLSFNRFSGELPNTFASLTNLGKSFYACEYHGRLTR